MSNAKGMMFGPVDLTHSEKLPLHQRHLTSSNCWMLDHWMLGGLVAGVTPLAHLENLPRPQRWHRSRPVSSLTNILDTDWSFSHTEVLSAVAGSHNLKCDSYWSHTSGVVWSTVSGWMPAEMHSGRLGRWQICQEWLPMLVQSWLDAADCRSYVWAGYVWYSAAPLLL